MVDPAKQFPVPLSGNQQLRSLSYQKFAQALFTCKQPDIKQILLMLTKVVSQTSRITFLVIATTIFFTYTPPIYNLTVRLQFPFVSSPSPSLFAIPSFPAAGTPNMPLHSCRHQLGEACRNYSTPVPALSTGTIFVQICQIYI